jgi:RNA-directed DNA polymerase
MEHAGLPRYMQAARLRKRAVLCQPCHRYIHSRQPQRQRHEASSCGEPDALKGASPVRRGAERCSL